MFSIKKRIILLLLSLLSIVLIAIPKNTITALIKEVKHYRDENVDAVEVETSDEYVKLAKKSYFELSYSDERGIFMIEDNRNGYIWKTGIDRDNLEKVKKECSAASDEYLEGEISFEEADRACSVEAEVGSNVTNEKNNSLLLINYYSGSNYSIYSANSSSSSSIRKLYKLNDDHFRLDVDFGVKIGIEISIHIYLSEKGIEFEVRNEEITGTNRNNLSDLAIAPYMGAVGGVYRTHEYDVDSNSWILNQSNIKRPQGDGYLFIPDGVGAIIKFNEFDVSYKTYEELVYGKNVAETYSHHYNGENYVPFKKASMPVYGIAHLDDEAAMFAYATSGDTYMSICAYMYNNKSTNIPYNTVFGKFSYNPKFLQVYNQQGWTYDSIMDKIHDFDINLHIDFLAGNGSTDNKPATYVGMAKDYQEYLEDNYLIKPLDEEIDDDISIRIDFLMSDSSTNIVGYTNNVATTASNVKKILGLIDSKGVKNVNGGLLGWNSGGLTLGRPDKVKFINKIGSKGQFESLIEYADNLGFDISFSQDYYKINDVQIGKYKNAVKHINDWYSFERDTMNLGNPIVKQYYFARPAKSIEWMNTQFNKLNKLGISSITVDGISNHLTSDYTDDEDRDVSLERVKEGFEKLSLETKINANNPNYYLWKYVDRYLQLSVYSSQYLYEESSVPFIPLILRGHMELYSEYVNFSFYDQQSILKMIEYNIYPSFVLTYEPAYVLAETTMGSSYFTTEYNLYLDLVEEVYTKVNTGLKETLKETWISHSSFDQIVVNEYSNNIKVVLNYSTSDSDYNGFTVKALDYIVIKNGNLV